MTDHQDVLDATTPQPLDELASQKPLVIIVQGSPRDDGNCAALAYEAFNECEKAGLDAVIVSARALMEQAAICNGCLNCLATGVCIHHDEMGRLIDMIDEASGLIWITPIYFSTLPASLKGLIDRLQVFWARRKRGEAMVFSRRRPAMAVVVGSGDDPFGTDAVSIPLTSVSHIIESDLAEPLVLLGLEDPDALLRDEHEQKLEVARRGFADFANAVSRWDDAESALITKLLDSGDAMQESNQ